MLPMQFLYSQDIRSKEHRCSYLESSLYLNVTVLYGNIGETSHTEVRGILAKSVWSLYGSYVSYSCLLKLT